MRALIILILLLSIPLAYGASIHGIVYDIGIDAADKSIVTINTVPKQQQVAIDGEYSFNIPKGNYTIKASYKTLYTEENITITDEGNYTLDLFLFEDLETDLLGQETGLDENLDQQTKTTWKIPISIIIIILSAAGYFFYKRKKKPIIHTEDEAEKVIALIIKHGKRTTQQNLRKELGMSEAKLSLILTDLEHQEKLRKIKKGRANIIILNP